MPGTLPDRVPGCGMQQVSPASDTGPAGCLLRGHHSHEGPALQELLCNLAGSESSTEVLTRIGQADLQ